MEEKIWFALVGVTPLKENKLTPEATGAYIRIACVSTKDHLKKQLGDIFKYHQYLIFEITDVKSEDSLSNDDKNDNVTQKLLAEIDTGLKFTWGTFHTW